MTTMTNQARCPRCNARLFDTVVAYRCVDRNFIDPHRIAIKCRRTKCYQMLYFVPAAPQQPAGTPSETSRSAAASFGP